MDRDRLFELRVLTGIHAGARALLPGEPQVLGSSPDCDLVLTDEGVRSRHARLEQQADGSTVLRWLHGDLPPLTIHPGQAARLGSVHIAVDSAEAPWRSDVPVCNHPDPPDDAAAPGDPQAPHIASRPSPALAAQDRRTRATPWVLGLFAAASVTAVAVVGPATRTGHPSARAPHPPTAARDKPVVDPLAAMTAAIARAGLTDRVRVVSQPGRLPWVEASFLSAEEAESLASALTRLSPRPGLRLVSAADLESAALAALDRHAASAKGPLSFEHVGDGHFLVRGRVREAQQRDEILSALAAALPAARGIRSELQTDEQAAETMLEDLRRHGLAGVSGRWHDQVLQLDVRLPASEVPRWERTLLRVAGRHDLPFRATLHLADPPAAPPPRTRPVLPFTVRSVVGGELPYVVLPDGHKLVPGARWHGWQLLDIRPSAVVFESAEGRQLSLER